MSHSTGNVVVGFGLTAVAACIETSRGFIPDHQKREVIAKLEADAQALADVRTLDDWAAAPGGFGYMVWSRAPGECVCALRPTNGPEQLYGGPTPDEARAEAAAWVREQGAPPKPGNDPGVNWDRGNLGH